jgi:hypothetical protein
MRLTSSNKVITAAELVIRHLMDAYAASDRTFDDLRRQVIGEEFCDPLRDFSEACRVELRALRG